MAKLVLINKKADNNVIPRPDNENILTCQNISMSYAHSDVPIICFWHRIIITELMDNSEDKDRRMREVRKRKPTAKFSYPFGAEPSDEEEEFQPVVKGSQIAPEGTVEDLGRADPQVDVQRSSVKRTHLDPLPVVFVREVSKTHIISKIKVEALKNVSLSIQQGDFIAISGPSGSGKTTLLNLIGCIEVPTRGEILIDGAATAFLSPEQLANLRRRKIGFIFQNFNLLPVLTALENVEYPLRLGGRFTKDEREFATNALIAVGLGSHLKHRPLELSGGQRQRVAIARALVTNPKLVLADEPTANLDRNTGQEILHLMAQVNQQFGTTFIFSTHDQRVMEVANTRVILVDGRVEDII